MSIESSPFEQATTPFDILWKILAVFLVVCIALGILAFMRKDFSVISNALGVFARIALLSACIGLLLFLWLSSNQEKEDWQNFAAEHCKVIEKRDGQNTTGVGLSLTGKIGAFFGRSSAQTGYQCDDGVTYWKNE